MQKIERQKLYCTSETHWHVSNVQWVFLQFQLLCNSLFVAIWIILFFFFTFQMGNQRFSDVIIERTFPNIIYAETYMSFQTNEKNHSREENYSFRELFLQRIISTKKNSHSQSCGYSFFIFM
jgi:hypothetical protein